MQKNQMNMGLEISILKKKEDEELGIITIRIKFNESI